MPYITKRRIYYKIGREMDHVDVPLDKWASISVKYWEFKQGKITGYPVNLGFIDFDISQIKNTKEINIFVHEKGNQLSAPVLTEEQKQRNHQQFEKVRQKLFTRLRAKPEWVNPYQSGHKATMTKDELSKCRREFFDVLFESHDHEDRAWGKYVAFLRNKTADPRSWDRYAAVLETKDPDLYQDAKDIFL